MRTTITALLLFLAALPVRAQVLYGSLVGNVADPSNSGVPGAQIRLTNSLTGVVQKVQSDGQGSYRFSNIQSGTYEVECSAAGFRSFRRTLVEVGANEVMRVDIKLEIGEATQSVTVAADAALLQTDNSDVHKDLSKKELTDLPIDGYRNYQSL